MADKKILLVEDEAGIAELIRFSLATAGYVVQIATNVRTARTLLTDGLPHAVILDWMLPDESGIKLLRDLRSDKRTASLPVVMLTARSQDQDKVGGLDAGADDYITKPFSPSELQARLRALLRRRQPHLNTEVIEIEGILLDPVKHRVTYAKAEVELGPTEFKLLRTLMMQPGRVFSRQQLLDLVWGDSVLVEERTVDVHILRLRKALSPYAVEDKIRTVRGVGYAFGSN
jgi:two-component system phosphate regulon response regulator PhoB